MGPDQKIWHYISEDDIYGVLKDAHDGPYKGHFVDRRIGHKEFQMGHYCPYIFCDARKYVQGCDSRQQIG